MKRLRKTLALAILALAAQGARPTHVLAQQWYECTTTTTTRTASTTLDDGTKVTTTVVVSQTVCVPITIT